MFAKQLYFWAEGECSLQFYIM
ncbi:hypothetical protein CBM2592_B100196 [Cupriavidus taiwanensis]|nr:hypothetical protein CBM2592_B100196 [Cupriavidus taiwanensis]SOY97982.1 hypothetical protein CBM2591_B80197 [Cupriavidus taiwanensis]SOZ84903.1 hypothetical protein CBM2618_B120006 [Cupriavidus taiwanensis]SOZ88131.1 hypothetical protein CBM2622_B130006 [Cupriavidus taiwanensis]SPD57126.1 protein of unknown function [Cupriavidus taiwanensis]